MSQDTTPKTAYQAPTIVKQKAGSGNIFGNSPRSSYHEAIAGVPISDLVQTHGSPLFVLSEGEIRARVREFHMAFGSRYPRVRLGWSYKEHYLAAVCQIMHQEGSMAEVVSGTEFRMARQLGVRPDQIIYNGPHKDDASLIEAMHGGTRIHLDNSEELLHLEELARAQGFGPQKKLAVAIRVNMQLDAQHWDRFGFNLESGRAHQVARRVEESDSLCLRGLHCHIGTYVDNVDMYRRAALKLVELANWLRRELGVRLEWWDLGGGFASRNTLHWAYQNGDVTCPTFARYAEAICGELRQLEREEGEALPELFFESGRALIEECQDLVVSVISERRLGDGTRALVLDAGVNLLSNSYWYRYDVCPTRDPGSTVLEDTTLLGNLCMQIDVLRKSVPLPPLNTGDTLVIRKVGAYNLSQSTQFIHGRPAVLLGDEQQGVHVVRVAETAETMRIQDRLPAHLRSVADSDALPRFRADGDGGGGR